MKPNWSWRVGLCWLGIACLVLVGPSLVPAQQPKLRCSLKGDLAQATFLAFSPDGRALVAGGSLSTIALWDVRTGNVKTLLRVPSPIEFRCAAFSPDGKLLAAGGMGSRKVWLWDVATGQDKGVLEVRGSYHLPLAIGPGWIDSIAFSPDGKTVAVAGKDEAIRLWDKATHKEKAALRGHLVGAWSVAFSPDGKTLASGGMDGSVMLWNVRSGNIKATLRAHTALGVFSVAFSPDGKTLASAGQDKSIKLWDVDSAREKAMLRGHADPIRCVAFSPDGKTLAAGDGDDTTRGKPGVIKLWHVGTGRVWATLRGHTGPVWSVVFLPDGTTLASGSSDMTIKLWDIPGARKKAGAGSQSKKTGSGVVSGELKEGIDSRPRFFPNIRALGRAEGSEPCLRKFSMAA